MNNGKVRIYELSKELNLENKDLLGICEGLNIVVKSHSSSISEAEAEQIVKAANEKFPDRHNNPARQMATDKGETVAVPKSDVPKSSAPNPAVTTANTPRPTEPKARILQIEHKSDRTKPSLMPQPPLATQQPPLRQPAAPQPSISRPVVRPTVASEGTAPARRVETTAEGSPPNRAVRADTPVQPPAPKPQLSGPPARPVGADSSPDLPPGSSNSSDSNSAPAIRSAAPNKPIPKSQLVKNEPSNRPAVGAPPSPGTGVVRRPVAKSENAPPPLNRPPTRIVQIKPQGSGPTRPGAPGKDVAATDKDDATPTTTDLELKRP